MYKLPLPELRCLIRGSFINTPNAFTDNFRDFLYLKVFTGGPSIEDTNSVFNIFFFCKLFYACAHINSITLTFYSP